MKYLPNKITLIGKKIKEERQKFHLGVKRYLSRFLGKKRDIF